MGGGLRIWVEVSGLGSRCSGLGSSVRVVQVVEGGVRIHPDDARLSGRHGVQYVAQCVACAALAPVVWQ